MENEVAPTNDLAALEAEFLRKVREKGGHAGNVTLQRELGWSKDQYWIIRDRLVDSGHLELGRGKGGSVSLVPQIPSAPAQGQPAATPLQGNVVTESELYMPVAEVLRKDWARDMRFRSHVVEVTARQGRKDTGGTWTRPDIVVAALRVFPHVPGKFFDLITFELKSLDGIDITAVYEALSHRRAATQAYVWLHIPSGASEDEDTSATLERIADESRRHGVGLIVAGEPGNYESWDIQIRAARFEPDPEFLNEFIAQQLSPLARDELAQWFR
ncbi:hypothetical protein [Allomeiothermus silvanus]|uniref:hypothetical protein n=1 Tax=Allomeiothermus silvanus TaxID=52022 RepID=UPI0023F132CF|nr:hypothetical protein [Allomeiothermus silvanus]